MVKKINKGGRPTLYSAAMLEKAKEYLLTGYIEQGSVIPSEAGLACFLGVAKSTVQEWGKVHAEFSGTLAAIQAKQEVITLSSGLTGDFNATIAKLVLANHGYAEKQQTDHTSSDGSLAPTRIELVAPSMDKDSGK